MPFDARQAELGKPRVEQVAAVPVGVQPPGERRVERGMPGSQIFADHRPAISGGVDTLCGPSSVRTNMIEEALVGHGARRGGGASDSCEPVDVIGVTGDAAPGITATGPPQATT